MDGRSITGTKLEDDYGWDDVPDMSGLFIRAQEFENGANNDPDRTSSSAVGEYQEDRFRDHKHTGTRNLHEHNAVAGGTVSGAWHGYGDVNTSGASNNPGSETRPRNRNFYVYIRVN
jgi:hypothetical protein